MDNKLRLLEILTYLWNNTDFSNHATIVEIQEFLKTENINATRQTITEDIQLLQSIGWISIICERRTQNHYYISRRFFEEADVKVLCDAVRSSYFVSEKSADELVSLLKNFVGPSGRKNIDSPSFIDASARTKNNDVIKNANKISKAISNKKKISFGYFDYDVNKEKIHKHNKKYIVSPYVMVINDGKYYIAAYQEDEEKVKTFRIDKMDRVTVLSTEAVPKPEKFDPRKFEAQTNMFGGYESNVELLCHKDAMYAIIDKFGNNVSIKTVDDEYFKAYVTADVSATFFGWVVGFGGKIRIVGPEKVKNDYLANVSECVK